MVNAAQESEEEAARRDERMPSSAKVIRERVELLREVEGFLLQFIPRSQRASYRPFNEAEGIGTKTAR